MKTAENSISELLDSFIYLFIFFFFFGGGGGGGGGGGQLTSSAFPDLPWPINTKYLAMALLCCAF